MSTDDDLPDEALGAELLRVVARFNRWATRHAEWALPVAQARLLGQIDEFGAARIGDLARADHCSQPAMTTQVRRLEEAGLLERRPDPVDARAVLISLTPRGQNTLAEVRAARTAAVAPLLGHLCEDKRRHLQDALGTLSDLLDRTEPDPHPPHSTRE